MKEPKRSLLSSRATQFIVGFAIPTVILLTLSSDDRLGPAWAMVLALAFPVLLELYGLTQRRKPSLISIMAIIGILLVGVISLLGLSVQWLALRRSILYFAEALGVLFVVRFRPDLIKKLLDRVLNMEHILEASRKNGTEAELMRYAVKTGYMAAIFLALVGVAAHLLTLGVVHAPTGSADFNAQYAKLRIISALVVSVPLFVGLTALLVYLITKFEKLTGIKAEQLVKKKH